MIIGLDFDGTCVTHDYPRIGKDIGAIPVLKELVDKGHQIVLNTMRSGEELTEACIWLQEKGIPLYGINKEPFQDQWTASPKVYAQLYIDDASLGTPLKEPIKIGSPTVSPGRPYVDWEKVRELLIERGVL